MSHHDDEAKAKLMEHFKKTIEEFTDVQMNHNAFGIPTIPNKHIKPEWETGLSDIMFGVVGFSHFFGALAFRCNIQWSLHIPTAAAGINNGKFFIFINPLFLFDYLPKFQHRTFVIVHEVFHIFYEHGLRGEEAGYDHKLFNKAADYYIHCSMASMLTTQRCKANLELLPDEIFPLCYDTKYEGMTEDEIYKELEKQLKKQKKENQKGNGDNKEGDSGEGGDQEEKDSGSQSGDEDDGKDAGENSSDGKDGGDEDGSGDSDDGDSDGNGNGEGKGKGKGKGQSKGQGNGQGESFESGPAQGGMVDYSKIGKGESFDATPKSADGTEAERDRSRMEVSTAIRTAAIQAQKSNSIGDMEANIISRFLELSESKVDWRDECMEFFEPVRDTHITYSHFNRRSSDKVVFPSKSGEFIRVYYGVDSSGSMGQEDYNKSASELKGFLDQVDNWEVSVCSCDTKAHEVAFLESEEEDDLETVEIEFRGGGGTRMSSFIEDAQEKSEANDEPFDMIVIVTDGLLMEGDITDVYEGEIPVLVLTTRNKPEWLEEEVKVIHMED